MEQARASSTAAHPHTAGQRCFQHGEVRLPVWRTQPRGWQRDAAKGGRSEGNSSEQPGDREFAQRFTEQLRVPKKFAEIYPTAVS